MWVDTVVFDLGGVLIDWNPRYLYRKLFQGDEAGMEQFLVEVCSPAWNYQQDEGRSWAEAAAILTERFPHHAALIDAYHLRWEEMLNGPIQGSVEILKRLRDRGTPLYALTNWSWETFPIALRLFDFLGWFDGLVVSGEVKLAKPDPRIYQLLFERFAVDPTRSVFIDDSPANMATAITLGMRGIHFTDPSRLERALQDFGLL